MGAYEQNLQQRSLDDASSAMGATPDVGKRCLRFSSLDRFPLDAIGMLIASLSVDGSIAMHEAAREGNASCRASRTDIAAKTRTTVETKAKTTSKDG